MSVDFSFITSYIGVWSFLFIIISHCSRFFSGILPSMHATASTESVVQARCKAVQPFSSFVARKLHLFSGGMYSRIHFIVSAEAERQAQSNGVSPRRFFIARNESLSCIGTWSNMYLTTWEEPNQLAQCTAVQPFLFCISIYWYLSSVRSSKLWIVSSEPDFPAQCNGVHLSPFRAKINEDLTSSGV